MVVSGMMIAAVESPTAANLVATEPVVVVTSGNLCPGVRRSQPAVRPREPFDSHRPVR